MIEAIGDLIYLLITLVVNIVGFTIEIIIFLIYPSRRKSLKEKWDSNQRTRLKIVISLLTFLVLSAAIIDFIFKNLLLL